MYGTKSFKILIVFFEHKLTIFWRRSYYWKKVTFLYITTGRQKKPITASTFEHIVLMSTKNLKLKLLHH